MQTVAARRRRVEQCLDAAGSHGTHAALAELHDIEFEVRFLSEYESYFYL